MAHEVLPAHKIGIWLVSQDKKNTCHNSTNIRMKIIDRAKEIPIVSRLCEFAMVPRVDTTP